MRTYGAAAVTAAIEEALGRQAPHTQAVRHILDRNHRSVSGAPQLPLHLPDDERLRDLHVPGHDLASYDQILDGENLNKEDLDERSDDDDDDDDDDRAAGSLCVRS